MVCPFAIAKAFGLDGATRLHNLRRPKFRNVGHNRLIRLYATTLLLRLYLVGFRCGIGLLRWLNGLNDLRPDLRRGLSPRAAGQQD